MKRSLQNLAELSTAALRLVDLENEKRNLLLQYPLLEQYISDSRKMERKPGPKATAKAGKKHRTIADAGRKRMADAARERWRKVKLKKAKKAKKEKLAPGWTPGAAKG